MLQRPKAKEMGSDKCRRVPSQEEGSHIFLEHIRTTICESIKLSLVALHSRSIVPARNVPILRILSQGSARTSQEISRSSPSENKVTEYHSFAVASSIPHTHLRGTSNRRAMLSCDSSDEDEAERCRSQNWINPGESRGSFFRVSPSTVSNPYLQLKSFL